MCRSQYSSSQPEEVLEVTRVMGTARNDKPAEASSDLCADAGDIDPFMQPERIPKFDILSDKEREKIRQGCVQLQDAYDGRASHGLYSLLKGPAYKRVLFKVHTHDWWQNAVIFASLVHSSLIIWEAPNYQWAWSEAPSLDPTWAMVTEMACMFVFVCDIVFKMLYFGGWKDYVSKEWQRNYLTIVALFALDFVLYHTRTCPLRFARPIRLTVIAGRHRDVRRLVSFFPKMCVKLVVAFAMPLLGVTTVFAIICVRLLGNLPPELALNLGQDDFSSLFPAIRTLFLLATLDNFPIVVKAFQAYPLTLLLFLFFIAFAAFFLMSVSLGVMFELYMEDHVHTAEAEVKKEKKSMAKAMGKLDLNGDGKITWPYFREMLVHMRPHDLDVRHQYAIFKRITDATVRQHQARYVCRLASG